MDFLANLPRLLTNSEVLILSQLGPNGYAGDFDAENFHRRSNAFRSVSQTSLAQRALDAFSHSVKKKAEAQPRRLAAG